MEVGVECKLGWGLDLFWCIVCFGCNGVYVLLKCLNSCLKREDGRSPIQL